MYTGRITRVSSQTSVISWADVTSLIKQVEKEYCVRVEAKIQAGAQARGEACLSVSVFLKPVLVGKPSDNRVTVQGYFPQRRWRTATGCLVGLLYEAIEKLEKVRQEELERKQSLLWP